MLPYIVLERKCCIQLFATHGLQLARLLCPWNFPGKNTGVCCHFHARGSSQFRDQTCVSCISCIGRQILYLCTARKALVQLQYSAIYYSYSTAAKTLTLYYTAHPPRSDFIQFCVYLCVCVCADSMQFYHIIDLCHYRGRDTEQFHHQDPSHQPLTVTSTHLPFRPLIPGYHWYVLHLLNFVILKLFYQWTLSVYNLWDCCFGCAM